MDPSVAVQPPANRLAFRWSVGTLASAVSRKPNQMRSHLLARKLHSLPGKDEVRMPAQRNISRIVTPGPAVAGCQKVGHSFVEIIQADDFINTDPFIRLTYDRMEI